MSKSVGMGESRCSYRCLWGRLLRLFEMFLGPLEQLKPWRKRELKAHRFRVAHRECHKSEKHTPEKETNKETLKVLHETIKSHGGN